MSHLKEIVLTSPTPGDLEWIDKLSSFSYYEETTKHLFERGLTGDLGFWRISGPELDGVVAARVIPRGHLREFWIEFIHGKGLFKQWETLYQDLWTLARERDCSRVSWMCPPQNAAAYGRLMGFKPVATIFTEDQVNGQVG